MNMQKHALLGLTLPELQAVVQEFGMTGFAAKTVSSGLDDKTETAIDEINTLSPQ